jgi:putative oxidoreductase
MKLGRTLARIVIGALMFGHGTQKLFGWFGGHGRAGTAGFFESLGLRPGDRNAVAAGASEAGGGALLALGLATPLAGALISGPMITAIKTVHLPNGPWVTEGGYEYNLVLLAAAFAIVDSGPGPLSLDHALGIERSGLGWALLQLGAAAAGSAAILKAAEGTPQPPASPAETPSGDPSTEGAATS